MQTTTHFKLVSIDETRFWDNSITARAGRVFGVYLFDANRVVHCCELTPSYELYPVASFPLIDIDRTDARSLEDELREHDTDEVTYIHCTGIDAMREACFHDFGEEEIPEGDSWEDVRDRQIEYVNGNCCLETPKDLCAPFSEAQEMVEPALTGYLDSALFSSHDEDGVSYQERFEASDFSEEARNSAREDVKPMLVAALTLMLEFPAARDIWTAGGLGFDFWLTRNRQGAGFTYRVSSPHPAAEFGRRMRDFSHTYGSLDIVENSDGTLAFA